MPIQCDITQNTGVVTGYHVLDSSIADFQGQKASVRIKSYLSSSAYQAQNQPVTIISADISPLVQNAIVAAPSLTAIIEEYLLTTPTFSGGIQVG